MNLNMQRALSGACRAAGAGLARHAGQAPAGAMAGARRCFSGGHSAAEWWGGSAAGLDKAALLVPMGRFAAQAPADLQQAPAAEQPGGLGTVILPWAGFKPSEVDGGATVIEAMNRNARKPKKANKGARPCSSYLRRRRRVK